MKHDGQCENYPPSLDAYFLQCKIVPKRCKSPAKFRVFVNPPSEKGDGQVYLCDFCNQWDYQFFKREKLPEVIGAGACEIL